MPRPLLSEALRGEGAVLRDAGGVAFMTGLHPLADLAPRDVVSRAVHERMQATGEDHVWLDATMIDDFQNRFPTIWFSCVRVNLDPTREWLPVAPAAHYLSGGVITDLDGTTTLAHLWACGEVACSGVHGANRLASNSLLDGLVFGRRVVDAILDGKVTAESSGAMTGVLDLADDIEPEADRARVPHERATDPDAVRAALQRVMSSDCGVVRDADGLQHARETLGGLARTGDLPAGIAGYEVIDLLRVSRAIVASATERTESRGSHTRREYPDTSDALLGRFVTRGGAVPVFVALPGVVARGRL
jgi:L-aspartate oxidase